MPATPTNWSTVVTRQSTDLGTVTKGVDLSTEVLDTVTGRQPTQTLSIDTSDPNVRIGVVGAGQTLINPSDETVTSMAARTGAVAGVNGGFFDINASGQPDDGQIVDGEIWKSPLRNHNNTFVVKKDGTAAIGDEEFSGTITDGSATHPLFSINWTGDAVKNQITEITPRLGGPVDVGASSPIFATGTSTDNGATITITAVGPITSLPALAPGTAGLLASSTGGTWLSANLKVGDTVTVGTAIAPDNDIQQLMQGPGQQLVKDGNLTSDLTVGNPSGLNPETAVGVSKDGKHLTLVTLDGRGTSATAIGPNVPQVAGLMQEKGANDAILLDGGGSTEMVARVPGDTATSVQNVPSDGVERPVGNGIFVYSTATSIGAPVTATINGGVAAAAVVGFPTHLPALVADAAGNPITGDSLSVVASPASLGSWAGGTFTPNAAGTGTITVTDGTATAQVAITVEPKLASLSATPAAPDLNNAQSSTFALAGITPTGASIPVPVSSATWTLSDPTLGTIDPKAGVFTAAASGSGLETLTASAAGVTTTISIAVGSKSTQLNAMDDSTAWSYNITNGSVATETTDPDVPPGSTLSSSVRLDYTMPGTSGVHQLVMSPRNTITIDKNTEGQDPTALAVWIKDDDAVHNAFEFATSYKQGNGQTQTLYNTALTYNGWTLLKTQLPAGTVFPLTLSFVDLLSINPTLASAGTLSLSSLQVLYSARTPVTPNYTAVPKNPSWLQYEESPSDFTPGGQTILMGDDAHMLANDPKGTSSNVMDDIAKRVSGTSFVSSAGQKVAPLPTVAQPTLVQMLGDMSDDGLPADLNYAASKISALGKPYHDLVGNHEITQGAAPENGGFNATFGQTHYAYTAGAATVIATDNSHGGITSSDPFQVPTGAQYPWLVSQLDAATTPVVIVAVHMPADDPFPAKNSQFTDRWEAQQYLQLVQNYQDAHPKTHVIMVYGHARGYSEQILGPQGDPVDASAGIPQFVFGDLGMPAYTTADQGGFYHFGLIHITANGTVQFAVEPVLQSLAIDQPASATASTATATSKKPTKPSKTETLAVGATTTLTATGVGQTGDNLAAVTVPIADPASHVWSSSDSKVATVDARTGVVTGRHPGTVKISVTSGGLSSTVSIKVLPAPAACAQTPGCKG
jgi:exopolysaccharide biosynthesis protein